MPTYHDHSRKTTNVIFDPEVSGEIIAKAQEQSAIMQLAQRMSIAPEGKKFQTITGDPAPEWVAETNDKPVDFFSFGTKTVIPYKMALIVPFSMEFRRDKTALYNECIRRVPALFGQKFDATAMGTTAPGTGFDVFGGASKATILPAAATQNAAAIDVYDRFLAVDSTIGAADGIMNGIALAPQGRSVVLGAKDGQGYPIFTPGVQSGQLGNILGAAVSVKKGVYVAGTAATQSAAGVPAVVGIAGDWDNAAYGVIGQLTGSISEEATLTYTDANSQTVTLALWQKNMFAVRFEIELALMVRDINKFVLLTGATPTA
jgi:HK97 family phage major capsid protein